MKSIKLAYGVKTAIANASADHYKVLSVKNATDYHPGQILDRLHVDELCRSPDWDVTVVPLIPYSGGSR